MQITLVDSLSRQVGVAAITGYQKHISPHKGFVCAHRVLYGGDSCSGYIKRMVAQHGFKVALVKSRERFQACKQAYQTLRSQSEKEEKSDSPSPKKDPLFGSDGAYCVECADVGCNCVEVVSLIPDSSSLDCGGLDCGVLDCGSCGG
ncbi:membrane protein insertion efficiency factor YidD [Fortiea contorta]|uniref:membrane protein insertion efficiency factor YidD n=1 Tax=Fortiea contorta TaxID=1892405 RepID=UPI000345A153|nr:membrane protein insertion efficiency factor YidD [Fortiea contorta]